MIMDEVLVVSLCIPQKSGPTMPLERLRHTASMLCFGMMIDHSLVV